MQSLFEKNVISKRYKGDLKVPIQNSVTFGDKSTRVLGPNIWSMLPADIKEKHHTENLKHKFGPICNCNTCKYSGN